MSKFIAALLMFFSTTVLADALIMDNKGGGKIVLTSQPCYLEGGEKFLTAVTWAGDERFRGCWHIFQGRVYVLWETTDGFVQQIYELENFQYVRTI